MEEEIKKAKNDAYRLLSYRWYTKKEIESALLKKGYKDVVIATVIQQLEEDKYIDDQRFTEIWLENRAERKLLGARRLRYELKEKGIADSLIQRKMEELFSQEKELELALAAARKKANLCASLEKEKSIRRVTAFLQRKGFSYAIIRQVLDYLEEEG